MPVVAYYAVHGVVLACEQRLELLAPIGVTQAELEVRWEEGLVGAHGEIIAATEHGPEALHVLRTPAGFLVRVPGVGDYVVDAAALRIDCRPAPKAERRDVEQVLIDQVLPRVLAHRGRLCLHASAVELLPGVACAFVGETGAGKSTLAAALAAEGAPLLSDDAVCALVVARDVQTAAGCPHARLHADAAAFLGTVGDPARRNDKHWLKHAPRPGALRLGAIFALAHGELAIEPASPAHAVAELSRHLLRLDPSDGERLRAELDALIALTALVPVAFLRYPRRFEAFAQVSQRLRTALTPR